MSPTRESLISKLEQAAEQLKGTANGAYADRYPRCLMWLFVLRHAPPEICQTAAAQIAHAFHPKAELSVHPELHADVEILALTLLKEPLGAGAD